MHGAKNAFVALDNRSEDRLRFLEVSEIAPDYFAVIGCESVMHKETLTKNSDCDKKEK